MSDEELSDSFYLANLKLAFEELQTEHEALKAAAREYLEDSIPDYPGCDCSKCTRFKELLK